MFLGRLTGSLLQDAASEGLRKLRERVGLREKKMDRSERWEVTFSINCIVIKSLQFRPTNLQNFINITTLLQNTSCYMFRASLTHRHGAKNCTK